MHAWAIAVAASLTTAPASPSAGQGSAATSASAGPARAATSLSPGQARAVVEFVVKEMREHYVLRERRAAIVAAITAAQRRGRYDVSDPIELAARLGDDLAAAGRDKHLWVRWAPDEYRGATAPNPGRGPGEYFSALGRRRNQGVEELRILPGNLRYMKYTQFMWEQDVTGAVLDDAMRFLRGGDAVIIDVRGNGGGSAEAVQYLVSHFIDRPGELLVTFHDELRKTRREHRVLDHLPTGRMAGKPLYVLIDGGSGSATEEFASHIKLLKLGTLVGKTTAGAAHNNAVMPVAPGFMVSVSVGRPALGPNGGDWEGKGVAPDRETSPAGALEAAQLAALQSLEGRTQDPALRASYAWARTGLEARAAPRSVSASELARHAGRYAGDRTVRVEGSTLVYARPGREDVVLTPMGGALFGYGAAEDRRIEFTAEGMTVLFADGQRQSFARGK